MNSPPSPPERSADVRFTGAVYTPQKVAAALVDKVSDLIGASQLKILEPSVGDGAFLREMRLRWAGDHYTLVDIDEAVIEGLRQQDWARTDNRVTLHAQDFLIYALPLVQDEAQRFDLVIGNPPFIRSRNFSQTLKASVDAIANALGYPRPDLKNSWAAFLMASARLVSAQGVMAFVLPYELITVAYGQAALRRLVEQFHRIDIYVSREKAFPELDQDAIVLIAQKAALREAGLFINQVDSLSDLTGVGGYTVDVSAGADRALELNAYLLDREAVVLLKRLRVSAKRLDYYTGSAPGIVSAANEFFILKRAQVDQLGFDDIAHPVLKKGSFASHKPVFTARDFQAIAASEAAYILRLRGDRDALRPAVQAYIEVGEKAGYHERYKCQQRANWYEVSFIPREPAFFFKRAHNYPRLCINEADVYITDTAYGLRIRDGYTARGLCFSFYNTLTLLFSETDGRFYGGGVLELSPKEFWGLPLIYKEPTDSEYAAFLKVHEEANGNPEPILDFGDRWLGPQMGLSFGELRQLREAWSALRSHRLRHSGRTTINVRPAGDVGTPPGGQ